MEITVPSRLTLPGSKCRVAPDEGDTGGRLTGHTDWVNAVAIEQLDGRDVIVSGSHDQTVRIWDRAGRQVGDPLTGHTDAVAIGRLDGRDVIVSCAALKVRSGTATVSR